MEFNFKTEEINGDIFNYDHESMELVIFGNKVYLDPDLVSVETKIPHMGGVILNHLKTPKVENIEMDNKICGKKYLFPEMV